MNNRDEKKLIVSITSYPARIHHVHNVLSAIFAQTMKPYDMVLYLAQEQFPMERLSFRCTDYYRFI